MAEPYKVQPLTIGVGNAVAMTGMSWLAVRRLARELRVAEIRVSERRVVLPAAELLAALKVRSEREPETFPRNPRELIESDELTDEQQRALMRAMMGLELAAPTPDELRVQRWAQGIVAAHPMPKPIKRRPGKRRENSLE